MAKCALVFDNVSGIKKNQFPDVYILPIPIIENTKDKINEYFENETITNDEIITKLNNGVVFKTSQTIPRDLFKLLDVLADKYDKVFVFPNPPQISRQYENIKMHAADYKNVYVFEHNAIGPYCL
jgi:fatty acid-binding protein DegV